MTIKEDIAKLASHVTNWKFSGKTDEDIDSEIKVSIDGDGKATMNFPEDVLKQALSVVAYCAQKGCEASPFGQTGAKFPITFEGVEAEVVVQFQPSDDSEPVTTEWLQQVGFRETSHDTLGSPGSEDSVWIEREKKYWSIEDAFAMVRIPTPKTRRDVRDLCRVLGIRLEG